MQLFLHRFDLRLKHTFTIAHDSRDVQPTLIVELRDGAYRGYGEATATKYYGITIDGMVTALEALRERIEAYNLTNPEAFWAEMQPHLAQHSFALCALDQAAWDLWAKKQQQPLYKLWSLDPTRSPLTASQPADMADDSTAAIDAGTEHRIRSAIKRFAKDRVTIVIAHRLSSLMHADVILFMEEGRIVERGSHAELLALNGRYRALYDLQVRPGDEVPTLEEIR